jgi:hypothetical protein
MKIMKKKLQEKYIGENSGDEHLCQLTVGCAQQRTLKSVTIIMNWKKMRIMIQSLFTSTLCTTHDDIIPGH